MIALLRFLPLVEMTNLEYEALVNNIGFIPDSASCYLRSHMALKSLAQLFFVILLPVLFLQPGCGDDSNNTPGFSSPQKAESSTLETAAPYPPKDEPQNDHASTEVDWGMEANLDEMISMAKSGRIVEIDWHVLPNILRARTRDGRIFHLRNENRGVDLRNTLIKAGVKIGKDGIIFRHVF